MLLQIISLLTKTLALSALFNNKPVYSISPRQSSCENPSVRKEWNSVSQQERNEYIGAVLCLVDRPSKLGLSTNRNEDFVWVHREMFFKVHLSEDALLAMFLPWHRYFLHVYEQALRDECGYTGSLLFWDWPIDAKDPFNAGIFSDTVGIGGDGVTDEGCVYLSGTAPKCVISGPFAGLKLTYTDNREEPHSLLRCFTCDSPTMYNESWTREAVDIIMARQSFDEFMLALYIGPHMNLHSALMGDFLQTTSPNDPLFYPHHTQIDRLWSHWQQQDPETRQNLYDGREYTPTGLVEAQLTDVMHMMGLAPDIPVQEVMNITRDGGFCYEYGY